MHINKKKDKVGIIGLGYVGLPLYLLFSKKFITFGFEIDKNKVDYLKNKRSYIADIKDSELKNINIENFFLNNLNKLKECKYIIYTLPTPIKSYKPDLNYYYDSILKTFKYLKKGQTIIFESTIYPGATENLFLKVLKKNFNIGKNLYLCYSPERVDPGISGSKKMNLSNINKLISGYSSNCLTKVYNLYSKVFKKLYKCSSIKEAECAKVFENTFRYINISFVNEFKMICDKLNIEPHKVINASSSKPFGFKAFRPGPGIGGHCIPVDPFYLKWSAEKNGTKTDLIDTSKEININLSKWIKNKINLHIKDANKVLVIGLAYKKNVNDLRESPSLEIFKYLFNKKNKTVMYYDPFVDKVVINKKIVRSTNINKIKSIDVAIILTDHDKINYKNILKFSKKVLDSRQVYGNYNHKKIINI